MGVLSRGRGWGWGGGERGVATVGHESDDGGAVVWTIGSGLCLDWPVLL